ncbi:putative LRR receptor-like serine/threonine-protein kinase [Iris pallida]|uniref:LRR receptor-like serine/threonine-protein kinase n=1 Tax=Iris pallida TaxID=29817 RepID=A0AAX6G8A1_IRIPA|nr:putative LRR receptor-like serine/threonine-protein kinase [Iris pallida]
MRKTVTSTELLNSNFPRLFPSSSASSSFSFFHPHHLPIRFLPPNPNLPSPVHPEAQELFLSSLKTLSRTTITLREIESLHCAATKSGFAVRGQVGIGLLNLYAKPGSLDVGRKLFDEIYERDALPWTILISGFSRNGKHETGIQLFAGMIAEDTLPNRFTLASVLKCCANLRDLGKGREIHGWILRNGISPDAVLDNSILEFYVKCGAFGYAKRFFGTLTSSDAISWNIMIGAYLEIGDVDSSMELFGNSLYRDVSSWNTIINGLMQNGFDSVSLQLLYRMVEIGPQFNHFTYSMAVTLAGTLALLALGRQIHGRVLRLGYEHDGYVRNSLISMYTKCGKMEASSFVFSRSLHSFDGSVAKSIDWSSMIAGFVQNGRGEEALHLFFRMLQEGVSVDQYTLTSIASACSSAGILEQGKQVHACVEKLGYGIDVFLASAITDMYAKCGSLTDARKNFESMDRKNVVLWTSIIGSYASHGHGREAIQLFDRMLNENIMPNEISFVAVLSACSHGGLVKEGYKYFRAMQENHNVAPGIEHFTCMVDLLGRAGLLDEARNFIYENSISHHTVMWRALLSACRVHQNVKMAVWASEQLVQLDPDDVGSYVLLSNIYASQRKFAEASKLRKLMQDRGMTKEPGWSWIQLRNKVHAFVAGDRSHPEAEGIYSYLERLFGRLKGLGYSSRNDLVLHDVEEEQRESMLSFHSEKLAIAYGIISTPSGTPLRVMKNLRVCADCHEAIKYISQDTSREIVLRDAHRFHHFKQGECSCGDYW